jgi:hypothetical protein
MRLSVRTANTYFIINAILNMKRLVQSSLDRMFQHPENIKTRVGPMPGPSHCSSFTSDNSLQSINASAIAVTAKEPPIRLRFTVADCFPE